MLLKGLVLSISLLLVGCNHYYYKSPTGCELRIHSVKEMDAGGIIITEACAVLGGAVGVRYNKEQMEAFRNAIDHLPN